MIGRRRLLLLWPRRRDDERSVIIAPPVVPAVRIWLSAIAAHRTGLASAGAVAVVRCAAVQSPATCSTAHVAGAGSARLQRVEHFAAGRAD